MNKKIAFLSVLVFVISFLLHSCGTIPAREYYLLHYKPLKPKIENTHNIKLQFVPLSITPVYDDKRIVRRFSLYKIQYYNYQRWAGNPVDMVSNVIEKHIVYSGLVNEMRRAYLDERPDYVLKGSINALEQIEDNNIWYAHLTLNLKLIKQNGDQLIWSYDINEQRQLFKQDIALTAEAVSMILEEEIAKAILELDEILKNEKK